MFLSDGFGFQQFYNDVLGNKRSPEKGQDDERFGSWQIPVIPEQLQPGGCIPVLPCAASDVSLLEYFSSAMGAIANKGS